MSQTVPPIEVQINSLCSGPYSGLSLYIWTPETRGYVLGHNSLRYDDPAFKPEHIKALIANLTIRIDGTRYQLVPIDRKGAHNA